VKTKPKHWLDFIFWPILKICWEPFSKKRSHFWHWLEYPNIPQKTLTIRGIKKEKPREGFWPNFWQTNFGWKNVVVIEPHTKGLYNIGLWDKTFGRKQLCSCLCKGRIGLLIGPSDVEFFALDKKGDYCDLIFVESTTKKELSKTIKLY